MSRHERVLLDGPDGLIEVFVEHHDAATGVALIAHPHPLFGGTADNKVVTTLAKAFRELGCATLRPSFRGVGGSEGEHDHGFAETEDLLAVHAYAVEHFGRDLPIYLAGFSFGAHVVTRLAQRLATAGDPAQRLVLVGTAAGFVEGARTYETKAVAPDTIVIHGAQDETVPLANVLRWAEPLDLPIAVIPGADHFFHRKLHLIRSIIHNSWSR
ncbi:MAG: alpha/beta hydrolase [Gammaproteobacteria bacterium]|nr:alpha/beta hydrolase [Gammaproteobacteria bacterium]MBU1645648.1 alpha/beta hydrolase [Gammaproteobacteria bacterium]MBU1973550.1 alpha/beta hydrolase [Gammaproteobacteria bacterium]